MRDDIGGTMSYLWADDLDAHHDRNGEVVGHTSFCQMATGDSPAALRRMPAATGNYMLREKLPQSHPARPLSLTPHSPCSTYLLTLMTATARRPSTVH